MLGAWVTACCANTLVTLFLAEGGWSQSTSEKADACLGLWKTLKDHVAGSTVSALRLEGEAAQVLPFLPATSPPADAWSLR